MVRTKEELAAALKAKQAVIYVEGPLAAEIKCKAKRKKKAKVAGGLMIIGGMLAAPFTGGASLAGTAAGIALTTGLVISTTELAIIAGLALGLYGLSKAYDVEFNKDGTVKLTKKCEK